MTPIVIQRLEERKFDPLRRPRIGFLFIPEWPALCHNGISVFPNRDEAIKWTIALASHPLDSDFWFTFPEFTKHEREMVAGREVKYCTEDICNMAIQGSTEAVRALLKAGADPHTRGHWGKTPLHFAASSGHLDIIRLLLEAGAHPKIKNGYGNTPLQDASHSHPEAVALMEGWAS